MKIDSNALGIAGEFRVMSELFLRGFNPAKSYLENGVDITLFNGLKIQVKTTAKPAEKKLRWPCYHFSIMSARWKKGKRYNKRLPNMEAVDFFICWCIDRDDFYILPRSIFANKSSISIPLYPAPISSARKINYAIFRNNWKQLERKAGDAN